MAPFVFTITLFAAAKFSVEIKIDEVLRLILLKPRVIVSKVSVASAEAKLDSQQKQALKQVATRSAATMEYKSTGKKWAPGGFRAQRQAMSAAAVAPPQPPLKVVAPPDAGVTLAEAGVLPAGSAPPGLAAAASTAGVVGGYSSASAAAAAYSRFHQQHRQYQYQQQQQQQQQHVAASGGLLPGVTAAGAAAAAARGIVEARVTERTLQQAEEIQMFQQGGST